MIWFHTAKLEPLRRVCILKSEYKLLNLYESEFICGMIPDIMPNFAADQYNIIMDAKILNDFSLQTTDFSSIENLHDLAFVKSISA